MKTVNVVGIFMCVLLLVVPNEAKSFSWIDWINGIFQNSKTTTTTKTTIATTATIKTPELSGNCPSGYQGKTCDKCGVTNYQPNIKIVGGITAVPHSWPSAVQIRFKFSQSVKIPNRTLTSVFVNQTFLCGGTLISRDTVLTASHCIATSIEFDYDGETYTVPVDVKSTLSMYSIGIGLHDLRNFSDGYYVKVNQIYMHPSFDEILLLNDVAVIKLSTSVNLNKNVQIACLPTVVGYPVLNSGASIPIYAMGWGTTSSGGRGSSVLRNVKMDLYDPSKCSRVFPGTPKNWTNQLCAGYIDGGKDTCQGDSGSSIFIDDPTTKTYVAIGIVSYGEGCAKPNKPGIYTKISSYLPWINEIMLK